VPAGLTFGVVPAARALMDWRASTKTGNCTGHDAMGLECESGS
jgi:hypothetical protein